jgi:hypothetical protein
MHVLYIGYTCTSNFLPGDSLPLHANLQQRVLILAEHQLGHQNLPSLSVHFQLSRR